MKELADGKYVDNNIYWLMVSWSHDINKGKYIINHFNKTGVKELSIKEFTQLFSHVSKYYMTQLKRKTNTPQP
jgi:hypothetical protein